MGRMGPSLGGRTEEQQNNFPNMQNMQSNMMQNMQNMQRGHMPQDSNAGRDRYDFNNDAGRDRYDFNNKNSYESRNDIPFYMQGKGGGNARNRTPSPMNPRRQPP